MISQNISTAAPTGLILPRSRVLEIRVGATLELDLEALPMSLIEELRQANRFRNPKYSEAKKRGYWTGRIDKYIQTYRIEKDTLYLPRGFFADLTQELRERGLQYEVQDATVCPVLAVPIEVKGKLYPYQEKALSALLKRHSGILESPPGSGKTCILLSAIARLRTTSLILVHTTELLKQTVQRCREWLGVEPGVIGGGKLNIKPVTVAMIQTLARRDLEKEGIAAYFGAILIDEAHHSPARTWAALLEQLPARYKFGFTATAWRKDGLGFLMWRLIGNKTAQISRAEVEEVGRIVWPDVEVVTTDYYYELEDSDQWQTMITDLVRDRKRNQLIETHVRQRLDRGTKALILSDRIKGVNFLAELLRDLKPVVLTGELSKLEREKAMKQIRSGAKLTLATSSLMAEGVDCPGWDLLFLASPFAGGPKTIQSMGRISRPSKGKVKALVVDFVDVRVPMLRAAWRQRQKLYAA